MAHRTSGDGIKKDLVTDRFYVGDPMIEVNKTYDLLPDIDRQAYLEYSKRAIRTMLRAPGIVEIRFYRSLLSSPQIRLTLVWRTLADWAKFAESPERQKLEAELLKFAKRINVELWGPSPVMPELLRPDLLTGKQYATATKMDFKLTWD